MLEPSEHSYLPAHTAVLDISHPQSGDMTLLVNAFFRKIDTIPPLDPSNKVQMLGDQVDQT